MSALINANRRLYQFPENVFTILFRYNAALIESPERIDVSTIVREEISAGIN